MFSRRILLATPVLATSAPAQGSPTRPVRIIVPSGPLRGRADRRPRGGSVQADAVVMRARVDE